MSNPEVKRKPPAQESTRAAFAEVERVLQMTQDRVLKVFTERGVVPASVLQEWLTAEPETCWPATSFEERKTEYVMSIALPGFDPNTMEVTATAQQLTIRATHDSAHSLSPRLVRAEARQIKLPEDCQKECLSASLHNGVLTVVAPKRVLPANDVPDPAPST